MSTRDLINAIESGDSVAIEQSFQQEMASRIADRLDDMRIEVAKNMFNEAACKTKMKSEEEMDEEAVEEEAELNLEDYSVEEVEEFMQTEDFEQLDELSKKTLGSYVKKASNNMADKQTSAQDNYTRGIQTQLTGLGDQEMRNHFAQKSLDRSKVDMDAAIKRRRGITKAVDKLTK